MNVDLFLLEVKFSCLTHRFQHLWLIKAHKKQCTVTMNSLCVPTNKLRPVYPPFDLEAVLSPAVPFGSTVANAKAAE